MPRGGARPGAGRKPKTQRQPEQTSSSDPILPGAVESAREWGLKALNSPDVPLDTKVKVFGFMIGAEAKDGQAKQKPEAAKPKGAANKFAPRQVKGFGVVDGGK